jgi:hypothetical protein
MPPRVGGLNGRLDLPSTFPEVRLFALLKWKFSGPNGPLSYVGQPGGDPDGPFKWDFLFVPVRPLRLQVVRSVSRIEVWWWGADVTREDVLEYLQYNLDLHQPEIDVSIGTLEEYTLILNPFARHRAVVNVAAEELSKIQLSRPVIPASVHVPREVLVEQGEAFGAYLRTIDRQALYAIALVSSAAFMAEAYLNLILAIFMREEVRRSASVLKETLFRKWRVKMEHLPIDCHSIAAAPDLGDARVRDAKRLFDLRNSIAHSYPDRAAMKIGTMWFDQRFPVLPQAVPFYDFVFALSNQLPSAEEALFCRSAAEGFVQFLRSLLSPKAASLLDLCAGANPIGFNEKKQIYGIPFGPAVILACGPSI